MSFQAGDWAWMPDSPWPEESIGRVFDVRDYGLEVWIRRLDGEPYYTYADQLEKLSLLEVLALEAL